MRALTTVAAALLLTGVADAQTPAETPQEHANSAELAVARAIADSMPDLRYSWQLEWSPFGSYASNEIRWHLAPPSERDERDPRPSAVIRHGRSISVSICGDDERVGAMSLETSDNWLGDGELKPELEALGLSVTELERRERHPLFDFDPRRLEDWPGWIQQVSDRPGYRLYRVEQAGHEPAFLTAGYLCTPPGTRHATHCSMTWTAEFRAGEQPRAEPCVVPPTPLVSPRPS
jgi:hypothetical protein